MNLSLLGYVAATCTMVSFVPQVIRTWKTKRTQDISLQTYLILALASLLWVLYGIFRRDGAIILPNTVVFLLVLPVLFLKFKHG